jgi:septum formation initiator
MKKLRFIGNFIFFSLVVYFVGQSVNVFLGRKAMQASLISTDKEIKELTSTKNKLLEQQKNSDEDEKDEKFIRNNLNLKKEGEEIYKTSE